MAHGITNSAVDSLRILVTSITVRLVTLPESLMKCYSGGLDGRKVEQVQQTRLSVIGMV